ncbi:MAG: tRNA (adenosine(37)-N6)-threonylcarbamoyltransferase complex dimerization subunit type 1 TsaB [Candidatus Rokubacteria bacterium]|nr:tRNA (adenosine(37)-N6)-threonylcarbamoyltransferase complex dimerization subunit type 1 TsaB [Candidatus Rokubacteria bacterium]
MRLLAVESSTLTGAVALLEGDTVVAESRLNVAVTHSERLLTAVDQLLAGARWRLGDVEALAVAVGPGSFTGLRIGVSTMKSLAFATGKPLVGIPTLDALAWTLPFAAHPVCPILDAKKGEVYTALYRTDAGRLERLWEYRALAPAELAARLREAGGPVVFVGDGIGPFRELLDAALGAAARFAPPAHRLPSAATVGDLARQALARGEAADPGGLVPLYVRRSEAELGRGRERVASRG